MPPRCRRFQTPGRWITRFLRLRTITRFFSTKGGVMSCGQCSSPPFISFVFAQEELIGARTPPWDRPAVSHD